MLKKDSTPTDKNTKRQGKNSPSTSGASSSEKPERPETIDEKMARVQKMIIENLKNPANHPDYRPYPGDK